MLHHTAGLHLSLSTAMPFHHWPSSSPPLPFILGKMYAPPKGDAPIITANDLTEADGIIFGFPTRFGMMAAQMKSFIDSTGGLWRTQGLAGKPAGIFYSTGSQGDGQETTPLTAITQLVHHGMIFVPVGLCPLNALEVARPDMGVRSDAKPLEK